MEAAVATFPLSRFIERVRVLELAPSLRGHRHEQLPDGRTNVVFRMLEEGRRGDICVVGPRTHALFKNAGGIARAVIVQLKPGWSGPLLGVAARAETDREVERLEPNRGGRGLLRPSAPVCGFQRARRRHAGSVREASGLALGCEATRSTRSSIVVELLLAAFRGEVADDLARVR